MRKILNIVPEIEMQHSSNKISNQLLSSLKSIKKTTRSLLSLNLNPQDYKLSQNLFFLEKEIIRLENLIRKREYYAQSQARGLGYLAFNDSLTGLPNRQFFEAVVESLIDERQHQFYLIFIDVDDFKSINDTYGHDFGDSVLKVIAQRINQSLREGDIVARYGGDEFVALVSAHDSVAIDRVMERLLASSRLPYHIDERAIDVQLSLGVASYPGDGTTYAQLIYRADQAMYAAKQAGKNSYQVAFESLAI
ncbi:GGDEF domain-containing protein [Candidatus Odyssella thessalonicensis]|uniref:GGDEF domain-containing protein n=1 Tax=Candidatus Odyssella thessalonicensis TaxID=84647 RepID=UPI0002F28E7D|nr:GGDEF domain-containing protein [Candidatus Odyssella thessalonicensis]